MNSKLIGHFTTFKGLINLYAARKNCGPHGGWGGGAVVASNLEWEGCGDSPLNKSWGGGGGGGDGGH